MLYVHVYLRLNYALTSLLANLPLSPVSGLAFGGLLGNVNQVSGSLPSLQFSV